MSEPLAPFSFDGADRAERVRVVMREGEPWFVAADLARILGYRDAATAVRYLDDDEIGHLDLSTTSENSTAGTHQASISSPNPAAGTPQQCTSSPNPASATQEERAAPAPEPTPRPGLRRTQRLLLVSEGGFYLLAFKSEMPAAKKFRKWVSHEVLPAIRRTGRFGIDPAGPSPVQVDHLICFLHPHHLRVLTAVASAAAATGSAVVPVATLSRITGLSTENVYRSLALLHLLGKIEPDLSDPPLHAMLKHAKDRAAKRDPEKPPRVIPRIDQRQPPDRMTGIYRAEAERRHEAAMVWRKEQEIGDQRFRLLNERWQQPPERP